MHLVAKVVLQWRDQNGLKMVLINDSNNGQPAVVKYGYAYLDNVLLGWDSSQQLAENEREIAPWHWHAK